jgi:hypothetical protein
MYVARTVENWYPDFINSVELIDTFVTIVEKQTEEAILEYHTGKQVEYVEEDVGGEEGVRSQRVETHLGLDDMSWSLNTLFEEYFPSLQRRSALLTVYGFFEYELHKLCLLSQHQRNLRLAPKDIQGEGIERSTDYLQKVVGLVLDKNCEEWRDARRVREIRNVIVHRNGRLKDSQGQIPNTTKDAVQNLKFLRSDNDVVLEEGFVAQAVAIFKAYFGLIGECIRNTQPARC